MPRAALSAATARPIGQAAGFSRVCSGVLSGGDALSWRPCQFVRELVMDWRFVWILAAAFWVISASHAQGAQQTTDPSQLLKLYLDALQRELETRTDMVG